MNQPHFTCSFTTDISANKVFESITKVSEWWAKNTIGNTQNINSSFTVYFGETRRTMKITEVIPGKKMVWHVIDCYLPVFNNRTEWKDTTISWEISTDDNLTTIRFTHIGLTPEKECYNDCVGGWSFFVKESLCKLITEGKGLPGVGIRSTISTGNRTYRGTLFFKNDPLPGLNEEYVLIDVKEIKGEHVVAANTIQKLDAKKFNAEQIKGDYYMIVENKPHFENINTLDDLVKM